MTCHSNLDTELSGVIARPLICKQGKYTVEKMLKTELLGTKFNSILEEPSTDEDSDYQNIRSVPDGEKQDVQYASLEFSRCQPKDVSTHMDDTSEYTEIKSK